MHPPAAHLLEVSDLTVRFRTGGRVVTVVDGVSFHVDRGETLAILGESGSGKSVSASSVMDLIDVPPGEIASGRILFEGRDLRALPPAERRRVNGREIAMIFQDPLAYLNPVYSIGWQIAEVFRRHEGANRADAETRTVALLERVGIANAGSRTGGYPHQFSGGQRQRIMIAMALALGPKLLIADEPTTALDVTVQAQILKLLKQLQAEDGMGMILITHDLAVAANVADRVSVMHSGKVVETGSVAEVFARPQAEYTRRLLASVPGQQQAALPVATEPRQPLLSVQNLVKTYSMPRGLFGGRSLEVKAVEDISFTVQPGETVGIVGESGSGKSTIARILMRLNEPSSGQALYRGQDIFTLDRSGMREFRRKVQMIFQDPYGSLNPRMRVGEIIAEPWQIHRSLAVGDGRPARDRVIDLLRLVGLEPEHIDRYPHQFSGGQRQRIAIARALASEPELLICDEAVSALDVSVQAQVLDLLADLRSRLGLAYIFITHDLPVVRAFASRILVMKAGRVVEEGPVERIFSAPQHDYTKALLGAILPPKTTIPPNPLSAAAERQKDFQ